MFSTEESSGMVEEDPDEVLIGSDIRLSAGRPREDSTDGMDILPFSDGLWPSIGCWLAASIASDAAIGRDVGDKPEMVEYIWDECPLFAGIREKV